MTHFKTSIVIPTYNHCDDLLAPCVNSILTYTHMAHTELIISANGCTDNTRSYVNQLIEKFTQLGFPDHVKLVWHDAPLGFSRAVNAGIKVSTGDRVLLLNNDVILLHQNRHTWLNRLHAPFETNPRVGITTTLKLFSPQTGRHFGVFFCTLIDRKVIDKIGLLNEEYGVGAGEDTEYCLMAEHAGFEVVGVSKTRYEPSIGTNTSDFPIWHKAEGTMHDPELVPNWSVLFANNTKLVGDKFMPKSVADNTAELARMWPELLDGTKETQSLFDDVLVNNGYGLSVSHMHNKEVIDVGANVGMFSIASAALGAHHVWAVEPVGVNHEKLTRNLTHTQLSHKVTTFKLACTGVPQPPVVMSVNEHHGSNSMYKPGEQSEIVNTITFEQLMSHTYSHDVIVKLDCEGAEFDIMLHTPDQVFDRIRCIHIEIHENLHPEHKHRQVIQDRLTQLGFHRTTSKNIGMNWFDAQGNFIRWDAGDFFVETWTK